MGITIHYRGTIDDPAQVETMEERTVDLVFSLGGRATIWRSFADHDRQRVIRGVMIEMAPGQETFSLLISPEGHLLPLHQIEEAEISPLDEPPYCFVKTQFGSLQGHVAIVHLLDALRQRFCSNLEVTDEGEYFETRDINTLCEKTQLLNKAIGGLADGLREHGLSREAAEDPSILAARIERVAALVQQKMADEPCEPSESASGIDTDSDDGWREESLEEEVEVMDRLRRKNDLRMERMNRRIVEAVASGMSTEDAIELAMEEEGLSVPDRQASEDDERQIDEVPSEPWLESLPSHPFQEDQEPTLRDTHPALTAAKSFLRAATALTKGDSDTSPFIPILMRASMDMVGGVVQATSDDFRDITHRALAITQLKRALTGHAYARGAVFGLRSEGTISDEQSTALHDQLESLLSALHELTEEAWG